MCHGLEPALSFNTECYRLWKTTAVTSPVSTPVAAVQGCELTTCSRLLRGSASFGSRTRDLSIITSAPLSRHDRKCNCNCNGGTCIAPPTRRPRAHHRVNPYLGDPRQNETKIFSDHDETSPVDRSSFSSVGSLFHARGAATEKALSPIRRRVRGTTRLPCTR